MWSRGILSLVSLCSGRGAPRLLYHHLACPSSCVSASASRRPFRYLYLCFLLQSCSGDAGKMRRLPALILGLCVRGTFSQLCPTARLEPFRPAWPLRREEGWREGERKDQLCSFFQNPSPPCVSGEAGACVPDRDTEGQRALAGSSLGETDGAICTSVLTLP